MQKTPKSLRLHIGIFGRTNTGKSSFLNMIAGQDVALTSPVPGTTTDVVEKPMELLPLGPVVFLDTAGLDDKSELGALRIGRAKKVFDRSDAVVLVTEAGAWASCEDEIADEAKKRGVPLIAVINKSDLKTPDSAFMEMARKKSGAVIVCSSIDPEKRELYVRNFKAALVDLCPEEFFSAPPLIGDLLPSGGTAVLVVPIDLQAPKGRLILPQVQTIRDALDNDAACVMVKEREYRHILDNLKNPPDIVVCDSQVVLKVTADTPKNIKCTTFSILFARMKGDLVEMARSAAVIDTLKSGDRVLISEACSHHPAEDDIGRIKIPRWLRQYAGGDIQIDVCCGRDFPQDLSVYKLIIHCGACMITRRDTMSRLSKAQEAGIPITNYGVAISMLQGVLERALSPFPAALEAFRSVKTGRK